MNDSICGFPPFYLATNRGFYKGAANALAADLHANNIIFTSNIRSATSFSSFEAAEAMFSLLLANSSCDRNTVSSYHAVLCCPVSRTVAASPGLGASYTAGINFQLPDVYADCYLVDTTLNAELEQRLHAANCCCQEC